MSEILDAITCAPEWELISVFKQDDGRSVDHVRVRHRVSGEVDDLHYERAGDAEGAAVYTLIMQAVIP